MSASMIGASVARRFTIAIVLATFFAAAARGDASADLVRPATMTQSGSGMVFVQTVSIAGDYLFIESDLRLGRAVAIGASDSKLVWRVHLDEIDPERMTVGSTRKSGVTGCDLFFRYQGSHSSVSDSYFTGDGRITFPTEADAQRGMTALKSVIERRKRKDNCLFGSLEEYRRTKIHNNTGKWSEMRHGTDGPNARVVYRIADLVHGPTSRGGQTISFGVKPLVPVPMSVAFEVSLKSNVGATQSYRMGRRISNPRGEVAVGVDGLSHEPFAPGECIAEVSIVVTDVKGIGKVAEEALTKTNAEGRSDAEAKKVDTVEIDGVTYIRGREPKTFTMPGSN